MTESVTPPHALDAPLDPTMFDQARADRLSMALFDAVINFAQMEAATAGTDGVPIIQARETAQACLKCAALFTYPTMGAALDAQEGAQVADLAGAMADQLTAGLQSLLVLSYEADPTGDVFRDAINGGAVVDTEEAEA